MSDAKFSKPACTCRPGLPPDMHYVGCLLGESISRTGAAPTPLADVLPDFGREGTAADLDRYASQGGVTFVAPARDYRRPTMSVADRGERYGRAMLVAIANLKASELAQVQTVAHVIRSLEDALQHD